jgi:queuine tRNA-ribosyltransferase
MRAFTALFRLCRDGATVHTYSGATATRSALLLAGFAVGEGVELDDGRHTTCAAMRPEDLARPLDRRWLERLGRSSAPFPPDAPANALARLSQRDQLASGASSATFFGPRIQNDGESSTE